MLDVFNTLYTAAHASPAILLIQFLFIPQIMVFLGFLGLLLFKRNIFFILIYFELILLGLNLNFILTSLYFDDATGSIFSLFLLTLGAIESVIGLTFFFLYFKKTRSFTIEDLSQSRG